MHRRMPGKLRNNPKKYAIFKVIRGALYHERYGAAGSALAGNRGKTRTEKGGRVWLGLKDERVFQEVRNIFSTIGRSMP